MKTPLVIRMIGAVFFLAFLPVLAHALTPGQVFDKVKNSVVVVKTLNAPNRFMHSVKESLLAKLGRTQK